MSEIAALPHYPSETGKPHMQFHIVSELNSKVLDIRGGDSSEGANVVMFEKKKPAIGNQLWYLDQRAVILSALNGFAFQSDGNSHTVKMHSFNGGLNQQWRFDDKAIANGTHECLDNTEPLQSGGADVFATAYSGIQSQHWRVEQARFYIVSEMNGKVLDIESGDPSNVSKVIMNEKKHPELKHQLWYDDDHAVIRSALNDFYLLSPRKGQQVKIHPFKGGYGQQWRFYGQKITTGEGECLEIEGASMSDGAKVIWNSCKGSDNSNQHWRVELA